MRDGGDGGRSRRAATGRGRSPAFVLAWLLVVALVVLGASDAGAIGGPGPDPDPDPDPDPTTAVADFNWSMASRYGRDDNTDGITDAMTTPAQVTAPFQVTFDACEPSHGDGFTWQFPARTASGCHAVEPFPEEGTYPVKLTVTDSVSSTSATTTQWVTVRDWLIVSVGDSTASGDGTPDVSSDGPLPPGPKWQDQRCHRSARAGPGRAAAAVEQQSNRSSVTFVHLACSGGSVEYGLLGHSAGQEPPAGLGPCNTATPAAGCLPPQLDEAFRLAGGRQIDALLVQGGANDVPFTDIVLLCFAIPIIPGCSGEAGVKFDQGVAKFPGLYQQVRDRLQALGQTGGNKPIPANRVFLTEYFDPTHSEISSPCTISGVIPPFEIDTFESAWASDYVLGGFRRALEPIAQNHGWNYVGGIASAYKGVFSLNPSLARPGHGYCAHLDRWINRAEDSAWHQDGATGTLHPNYDGQTFYGLRLSQDLNAVAIANDTVAPTVAGAGGFANGGTYDPGFTPTLSIDDARSGVRSVTLRLDGQPYEYGTPVVGAGPHSLAVTAEDATGNTGVTTLAFTIGSGPSLTIGDVTVGEGNNATKQVLVPVRISRPSAVPVRATVTTRDGTATAPGDYRTGSVNILFEPGLDTARVDTAVVVVGDRDVEGTESFTVNLSNPVNAVIGDGQGVITVVDDDGANASPTASAGPDQRVPTRRGFILSAAGSSDPEGFPLSYAWTQVGGPPAVIRKQNEMVATVDGGVPGPATLTYRVTVTDPVGGSAFDEVKVIVSK